MEFNVNVKELKNVLNTLKPIMLKHASIPALNNVLLYSDNGMIRVFGTDLESSFDLEVAETKNGTVALTVDFHNLKNTISKLTGGLVFKVKDIDLSIVAEDLKVTTKGGNPDNYPEKPNLKNKWKPFPEWNRFAEIVSKAIPFVSDDEDRPALMTVNCDSNRQEICATSGYILFLEKFRVPFQTMIPYVFAKSICKIKAEKAWYRTGKDCFQFKLDNNVFSFRSMDSTVKYPEYQRVIPMHHETAVEVNRKNLIEAVKKVGAHSSSYSHQTEWSFNNNLSISAFDLDTDTTAETEIQIVKKGVPMRIGFNCVLMLTVLDSLEGEEIMLKLESPAHAVVIEEDKGLRLIMPVKLSA